MTNLNKYHYFINEHSLSPYDLWWSDAGKTVKFKASNNWYNGLVNIYDEYYDSYLDDYIPLFNVVTEDGLQSFDFTAITDCRFIES